MAPRDTARALAFSRIALGTSLLVAPRLVSWTFLGDDARGPATGFYGRATGIRDLVLGGLALHTVDRPEVGPRYVATAAVVDTVDALAALAVRDEIGGARAALTVLAAAGGAAAGFAAARGLKAAAPAAG